jgi:uncharacterized HAD superfamily protein
MNPTTPSRAIVGVDADGVLFDFNGAMQALFLSHYGIEYPLDAITAWDYTDCLPVTQEQFQFCFERLMRYECEQMPLVPGAVEGMKWLAMAAGADQWVITARPDYSYAATKWALRHHGVPHSALIFADDKTEFADVLCCMIEDKAQTAMEFAELGVPVVLLDYPHNRDAAHPLITRVSNWPEVFVAASCHVKAYQERDFALV